MRKSAMTLAGATLCCLRMSSPRSCRVTFEAEDEEEEFLSQVMALTKLDDAARVIIAVSRYRYIDAAKFIELGMII